ncbi:zinc finger protein 62-like [Uranotaenia lowii]|uniref:zinc finger protein 62-like n=1 Tax=Uranotaenia lowii TaxID=190385 RepID=UPI0024785448|nr:zinc finger protein 62-like [Uranotaenia lowii]
MSLDCCIACTRVVEPSLMRSVSDNKLTQHALTQHFWFKDIELISAVLCSSCWKQIEDFHTFYSEIKKIHFPLAEDDKSASDEPVEIKEEPIVLADHQEEIFTVKSESLDVQIENLYPSDVGGSDNERFDVIKGKVESEIIEDLEQPVDEYAFEENYHFELNEKREETNIDGEAEINVLQITPKKRGRKPKYPDGPPKRVRKRPQTEASKRFQKDNELLRKHFDLKCDTCKAEYPTFAQLNNHSLEAHSKQVHVFCCNLKFRCRNRLVQHLWFHLNPERYRCEPCNRQFPNAEAFKAHNQTIHLSANAEKTFQCELCPRVYPNMRGLTIHLRYHRQLNESGWHCDPCDKHYKTKAGWMEHMKTKHSTSQKHLCHICAKSFQDTGCWRRHMEKHENITKEREERAQCDECDSWIVKSNMHKHKRIHSGSKTCNECGQVCPNALSLQYHRTQHKKQLLPCTVCEKTFKNPVILREHMAAHNGERLYSCDFCDKTFNSNANKASHRKKKHPREWMELKLQKDPTMPEAKRLKIIQEMESARSLLQSFYVPGFFLNLNLKLGVTATMSLENCIACTKTVKPDLRRSVADNKSTQQALAKHFWFEKQEFTYAVLCSICWKQIEDFHTFYCEIRKIHFPKSEPNELVSGQSIRIKEEPIGGAEHHEEIFAVKAEMLDVQIKNDCISDDERFEGVERTIESGTIDNIEQPIDGNESDEIDQIESDEEPLEGESDDDSSQKSTKMLEQKSKPPGGPPKNIKKNPQSDKLKQKEDNELLRKHFDLKCDTCEEKYPTFVQLKNHSLQTHNKKVYVFCCNKKFSSRHRLLQHMWFHLNPERFRCEPCNRQFPNGESLKAHNENKHLEAEKTFQCHLCPRAYPHRRGLGIHLRYHRQLLSENGWRCDLCDKQYQSKMGWLKHMETKHGNSQKHLCHICAKGFQDTGCWKKHMEKHENVNQTPEERAKCDECDSWIVKSNMRKHKMIHSGSKTCQECGQVCPSALSLQYHKAQHKKQLLSCTVCDKTFKKPVNLREHMAAHNGERLYSCDFCDKTFNSNANQASHRKKKHPREWMELKLKEDPSMPEGKRLKIIQEMESLL